MVQKGVLQSKNGVMSIICSHSSGNKPENLCAGGKIILKLKLRNRMGGCGMDILISRYGPVTGYVKS